MLMYFSALTFPSQTTSSERPAVQITLQIITEKPSNLTVDCRCCKENSWNGSRHTQIRPLSENCANQDSSDNLSEDNSISKLHRFAYHLWPPLLSERAKKWLPSSSSTAIPKSMQIADKLLGSSQPFWSHELQLLGDSFPQISWQHGKPSELAVDNLGMVKCFPCRHSWIAPTEHQH